MKLFFSYGHDANTPIVSRLKKDLELNGHEVWIDYEKIADRSIKTHDSDWRTSITNGIADSNIVLSFASAHALRGNGVCLDELKIAVFVRGAFVQALLLEPGIEGFVPPSISYRQYIDFSDWSAYSRDGTAEGPEFEEWYRGKLEDILAMLGKDEVQSYHDELKELADYLCPYMSTMKQDELAKSSFIGREWLSEKVREWEQGEDQALVISGSPGMGKSAFVVNEFIMSPNVGAAVFCQFGNEGINNIDAIVATIAYQMAARFDDYRKALIKVCEKEKEAREGGCAPRDSGPFERYILSIADRLIDGAREHFIILIDGLDEAQTDEGTNPVAKALASQISFMPKYARFILTSRNDAYVIHQMAKYPRIDLDSFGVEGNEDVSRYVAASIGEDHKLFGDIIERSKGNFLYAKLACDHIDELDSGLSLPIGLAGFYENTMERLKTSVAESEREWRRYYDSVRNALGIIAASEDDVPKKTLCRAVGWTKADSHRYSEFVEWLSSYLIEEEERLSFFHKSFSDWLSSDDAGRYHCDSDYASEMLTQACLAAYEEGDQAMNDYEMFNLVPLLNSNRKELEKECQKVLSDSLFFDALLKRLNQYKSVERIRMLRRVADCLPTTDPYSLSEEVAKLNKLFQTPFSIDSPNSNERIAGEEGTEVSFFEGWSSTTSIALQKAMLLESLKSDYKKMLRNDEVERCAKEIVEIRRGVLEALPTKKSVDEFIYALESYARLFEGFESSIADDYEKCKKIHREGIAVLESLDVSAKAIPYVALSLIHMYGNLVQAASFREKQEDWIAFASEEVGLLEGVVHDHLFEYNDKVECESFWRSYSHLCNAYFNLGDVEKGISVMWRGLVFLKKHLKLAETSESNSKWQPSSIRFNVLLNMHKEISRFATISGSRDLIDAAFEEYLSYIDSCMLSSIADPSEMLKIVMQYVRSYLSAIDAGTQEKCKHVSVGDGSAEREIIERVRHWFDYLDARVQDNVYLLNGLDAYLAPSPRESFAEALARAGLYDSAISELKKTILLIQGMELDEDDEVKQKAKLTSLHFQMADMAIRSRDYLHAIEYSGIANNHVRYWLDGLSDSVERAVIRSGSIKNIVDNVISQNVDVQCKVNGSEAACRVVEEKVKFYEKALASVPLMLANMPEGGDFDAQLEREEVEDGARAIKDTLSDAYEDLSDRYRKLDRNGEALMIVEKNVDLFDEKRPLAYIRALNHAILISSKSNSWENACNYTCDLLELEEEIASEDLSRASEGIIGASIGHAEYVLRLASAEEARSFLDERKRSAPFVYKAILQDRKCRDSIASNMIRIQEKIDSGRYDNPEIGRTLISIISEWSGVEAPNNASSGRKETKTC